MDNGDGTIDVRCPFSKFKKLLGKTLKHVCVADTLKPFVDALSNEKKLEKNHAQTTTIAMDRVPDVELSNSDSFDQPSKDAVAFEMLPWTVLGLFALCFVVLSIRHVVKRRMERQKYGALPMRPHKR